ncbi:rhodanese-like protein [Halobacteriovorax sp. BALOs_7]|uniref:Rhodanese-like domain-containing protein n=1 Tax=Halobacteriovorax vibrionivorans TaxID=2152716 RepID=A0ABY0IED8_9BACT|nr:MULTISPECIES: rhodanese-like domain-containing protein [Halobacteriovorax]AYF44159.1 rhodanese-like protein [Halobacteriovorax sp. BALOs_7]RZF21317.1 rhodanese-like domain-containing protein [Halobacteriovorax vibrionivorans]TGD47925.1 rhodanese-like domain-containing protein [Halobacteriovorax sp. Y22]
MKYIILSLLFLTSCIDTEGIKNQKQVITSMATALGKKYPSVKSVDCQYLSKRLLRRDNRLVLVDARNIYQYDVSHIQRAIPLSKLHETHQSLDGREVIVYSTIGTRATKAILELAKSNQKTEFKNLFGGILDWLQCGEKIYKDNKEVKKIRFENDAWNIVPKGYESILP